MRKRLNKKRSTMHTENAAAFLYVHQYVMTQPFDPSNHGILAVVDLRGGVDSGSLVPVDENRGHPSNRAF